MEGARPFEIVIAEPYDPHSIARLEEVGRVTVLANASPESLLASVGRADALLVRAKAHVTARIIEAAPNLKVIARASPTVDHIDLKAAQRRNISVVYAPMVAVTATAEFALGLILALRRRILQLDQQLREGKFDTLRQPTCHQMGHQVLGLLGTDPVADALGRLCKAAFGMRVICHDPSGRMPGENSAASAAAKPNLAPPLSPLTGDSPSSLGSAVAGASAVAKPNVAQPPSAVIGAATCDNTMQCVSLDELLAQADILSVHLPLSPETKCFLNGSRLARLKPSAIVINTSRGGVIDTVSLAQALKRRHLAGAGIDAFEIEPLPPEHPLRLAPNCILTPHVAGMTLDASAERYGVADDVIRILRGQPPRHRFELPDGKVNP